MRRLLLIVLGMIFVVQAGITSVVFFRWKIDQKRITELYCINKDNPLMHCEGNCYLSRQLKKIEQDYQHSKQPFNPKGAKVTQLVLYVESATPVAEVLRADFAEISSAIDPEYINHYSFNYYSKLCKPPGIVSVIS